MMLFKESAPVDWFWFIHQCFRCQS